MTALQKPQSNLTVDEEALSRRFGERPLMRPAHDAADEKGNGIRQEDAAPEIGK